MTKVRFTRSVTLEGIDYPLDSVHDIPEKNLGPLERSVVRLEPEEVAEVVEAPEEVVEDRKDVTVEAERLSLKPVADQKAVEAPKVDKMLKEAPKKK